MSGIRRFVTLACALSFVILAGDSAAQVRNPNRFLPLEVGNRWEFATTRKSGAAVPAFLVYAVLRDTVIDRRAYVVIQERRLSNIRTHVASSECVMPTGGENQARVPPAFPACFEMLVTPRWAGQSGTSRDRPVEIRIGMDAQYAAPATTTHRDAWTSSYGDEYTATTTYALGLGPYHHEQSRSYRVGTRPDDAWEANLIFARVGNATYGKSALPVASSSARADALPAFNIHPNPFSDRLVVETSADVRQDIRVELFDLLGHSVADTTTRFPEGSITIRVAGMADGMYLLRLSDVHGHALARPLVRLSR
ncbi:MAG: T9SS type A sorting domain-containing protein [Rhodothermales bacterium]